MPRLASDVSMAKNRYSPALPNPEFLRAAPCTCAGLPLKTVAL